MKKVFSLVLIFITGLVLVSCNNKDENTLIVGVVAPPMSDVIEINKEAFEDLGYKLEIKYFSDYDIVNRALNDKEIDLNFSQHELFMEEFNENFNGNLVKIQGIYTVPLFLYTRTISNLNDVNKNTIIGVPREPINLNRALRFLSDLGFLTHSKEETENVGLDDVIKIKEFILEPFELTALALNYEDIDMAVMYPSFGQRAGLTIEDDTISVEANILPFYDISIVGRTDNKDEKIVQDFISIVTSKRTKDYLFNEFGETYKIVYE